MKPRDLTSQKLQRENPWQLEKHVELYSSFYLTPGLMRESWSDKDSRQNGDINFCVRSATAREQKTR